MGKLKRVPAGARIQLQRALEPRHRLTELCPPDEERTSHGAVSTGVFGLDRQSAIEGRHPFVFLSHGDEQSAQLAPRARGRRLEIDRATEAGDRASARLWQRQILRLR